MKKLHPLFIIVIFFSCLQAAEENKDIQKKSQLALSFLSKNEPTKRRLYNPTEKPLLQNMQAVLLRSLHIITTDKKEDKAFYAAVAGPELVAKLGLLNDTKTLQENLHGAIAERNIERVVSCLAKERYLHNLQQSSNLYLVSQKQLEETAKEKKIPTLQQRFGSSFVINKKFEREIWLKEDLRCLLFETIIRNEFSVEKEESFKKLLYAVGSDVLNQYNIHGITLLHYTADKNRLKQFQLFYSCGANINQRSSTGRTPLHFAASNNSLEILLFLVKEAGANIDQDDNNGDTPIFDAVGENLPEATELLIKLGANIHKVNGAKSTLLHRAGFNNADKTAQLLITAGAHVNKADKWGRTPLNWARQWKAEKVVPLLKSAGAQETVTGDCLTS